LFDVREEVRMTREQWPISQSRKRWGEEGEIGKWREEEGKGKEMDMDIIIISTITVKGIIIDPIIPAAQGMIRGGVILMMQEEETRVMDTRDRNEDEEMIHIMMVLGADSAGVGS